MRGDGRSRRILVVPDAVVNPADGNTDHLSEFADQGWGVIALGPPGLVPVARDAWMDAIVDQVVTFLDDGYLVVLADGDDPESTRFEKALRATGRDVTGRLDLPR
jgi:hypothetical protein